MGGDYNIPMAADAKTVREFDDGLTRGMCLPIIILLEAICNG